MSDNQQPTLKGEHEEKRNSAQEVIEVSIDVLERIQQAMKEGAEIVNVAGLDVNAETANQNFQSALKILQEKLNFDENDLYFKQFGGETVGESHEGKIQIDPIMLMHPAVRLAHVIAHEISHRDGKVDNEALAEAFVQTLGFFEDDGVTLSQKYTDALNKFYEFVNCVAGGETRKAVVENLYKYYYTGEYEKIYGLFEQKYLDTLKTEEERDTAFEFFKEVFPELEVREGTFGADNVIERAREEYELSTAGSEEDVGGEEEDANSETYNPPTLH